jgi:hypothetical protein
MLKNLALILFLGVILLSGSSCGGASTGYSYTYSPTTVGTVALGDQYQIAKHRGVIYYIVVDYNLNSNKTTLERIGKNICGAENICQVWFFNDMSTAIAASSTADATQTIALYAINRNTGYEEMQVCTLGDC